MGIADRWSPAITRGPKSISARFRAAREGALAEIDNVQEPLNAPFLNGLFSSGFSRGKTRERKISPKFFRPKFLHGCPRGMSVPKCLFFQDLEGLTEVFGGMSAGMSGRKLPLWAEFSFLKNGPLGRNRGNRPIKVGKRPINEGKRPIKAMVLVGISAGCLIGCFQAPSPWRKTASLKRPIKRSMKLNVNSESANRALVTVV